MIDKIIIDADLCIKLGGHKKYTFLYDILPLVADKIYMHTHAHGEVLMPSPAVQQLSKLISENKVVLIIIKARDGEVDVPRKVAKALWIIAGKNKDIFDTEIWPVKAE